MITKTMQVVKNHRNHGGENMVYRCLNCGAATKYDAKSGRMVCDSCCSIWDPALLQAQSIPENETEEKTPEELQKERFSFGATASLDCPVYHCTACGAKLLINEVESATYCAYCGQPTVIFDRIKQQKQPKYIIPFRVSKALAMKNVKDRLSIGSFIPKEIRNVKPEHIRGIYIPYKLVDLSYKDVQIYNEPPSKKTTRVRRYLREGTAKFRNLTLDTSISFNDESAKRLEPYEMISLKPFKPVYLSGFYADCSDEDPYITKKKAEKRARELFVYKMKQQLRQEGVGSPILVSEDPKVNIEKMEDILLPAWFFVFRYRNKSYTIIVNGQTGKVVGTVPIDRKKVFLLYIPLTLTLTLILCFTLFLGINNAPEAFNSLIEGTLLLGLLSWGNSIRLWKQYENSKTLTMDLQMQDYSKTRINEQEGD